jgi:Peptidase family C25
MKAIVAAIVVGAVSILLSPCCSNSAKSVAPAAATQAQEISHVKDSANSVDYLVVYGEQLHDAAASFAAYRKSNSCSTAIVGYATVASAFPATATNRPLRGLFNYIDTSWSRAPKHVLLLGDAGWQGVPFADTSVLGDSTFSDAGTDSLLTFSVGRIPASTNDQALAVLDKIKNFEAALPNKVRFIVDNPIQPDPLLYMFVETFHDISSLINGTSFSQDSFLARDYGNDSTMWTASQSDQARTALFQFLDAGNSYVSYLGYGNNAHLSYRGLMNYADINSLTATNVYVMCGSFVTNLFRDTVIARGLLFKENGGAVAVIGNSWYQYVNDEARFQSGFFSGLTQGRCATLGDLFKASALNSAVITVPSSGFPNKTKLLFGDPAMVIHR